MPDTTKIRTPENTLFIGNINRLDQISAYFTLAQQSYGDLLGLGLCLSAKTKTDSPKQNSHKVTLLLDRDPGNPLYSVSYAFWPDQFAETISPEQRDAGFGNICDEIYKVFDSDYVEIEGIPSPKLGKYNATIRDKTSSFLLELSRKFDESKRDSASSKPGQPEQKSIDRKFLGFLKGMGQIPGYVDLFRLGYQKYDSFGLVFSSSRKHPFYVLMENTAKTSRSGPYILTGLWYDERVKLSEDIQANPQRYIARRIKARLSGMDGKIEGYANPPKSPFLLKFNKPATIDDLLLEMIKMPDDEVIEDTQKVETADEDKEVAVLEKKNPDKPLGDDFVKGAEDKLDDIFGK